MLTIKEEFYLINEQWRGGKFESELIRLVFFFVLEKEKIFCYCANLSVLVLNTCSINHMILLLCFTALVFHLSKYNNIVFFLFTYRHGIYI